jgi:sugar phosphate permease
MNSVPANPSNAPTRVRWLIFFLACAASWLLYLHRYSWGVIKPALQREHPELTSTQLGWLDSAFNLTYALGQVPAGLAGDYFGARGVLAVIVLAWSAVIAGIGWTTGFYRLYGLRTALGLTQAGAYPSLSKVTRTWFPLSVRTSVQGVVASLGRIGAACCPPIVATLLMGTMALTWQTSLFVIAAPGVLLAAAFWLVFRNSPREHPWTNGAEENLIEPAPLPSSETAGENGRRLLLDRRSLFSLGMLLVYAFASTFQDQLYVNWIPLFLTEGRGLDDQEMGLFTPLPLLGGAVGGVLGGVLNDYLLRRTGNRRWARSSIAFTGKFLAGCLVFVSVAVSDGRLAMVILLAARFFGDWSLPTQWGAVTDMAGRASATVFALVNAVGAIGGFVAGPVLGHLKQYHGWDGLFFAAAGMCILSAGTWLLIDCTRRLVPEH